MLVARQIVGIEDRNVPNHEGETAIDLGRPMGAFLVPDLNELRNRETDDGNVFPGRSVRTSESTLHQTDSDAIDSVPLSRPGYDIVSLGRFTTFHSCSICHGHNAQNDSRLREVN